MESIQRMIPHRPDHGLTLDLTMVPRIARTVCRLVRAPFFLKPFAQFFFLLSCDASICAARRFVNGRHY